MHTLSRLATVLVAGFVLSAPALAEKGKAFATVNGQSIPNSVYEAFSGEQKAQGTDISAPEIQAAIKEELVRREVLAQEAKKRGLDKSAVIQGQMELARQAVLIRTLLSEHVRANPVSEAQLRAEYDAIKASLGNTEYKARHVLVENEDQHARSSTSWARARNSPTWPSSRRTPARATTAANWAGAARAPTSSPSPTPSAS